MYSKLICGCALTALFGIGAMIPPGHRQNHRSPAIHQGAGALALISQSAAVLPPSSTTNIITWKYPPGIVPSNFWWNIESSTDLRHWSVVIRNATGAYKVTANKIDRLRVYRLSGRILP